jgi:hypothetical protein
LSITSVGGQVMFGTTTPSVLMGINNAANTGVNLPLFLFGANGALKPDFSQIVIGNAAQTGAMFIGTHAQTLTYTSPLVVQNPGGTGTITLAGTITDTAAYPSSLSVLAGGRIVDTTAAKVSVVTNGAAVLLNANTSSDTTTVVGGIDLFGSIATAGGNISLGGG